MKIIKLILFIISEWIKEKNKNRRKSKWDLR